MDINEILKDLYDKRKEYKKTDYIANFDFASLYPTTMRIFNDDEFIKEQKRIKREKKLKRILGEN